MIGLTISMKHVKLSSSIWFTNLGLGGFFKFKKAIAAIYDNNWQVAAAEMRDSRWYKQTPNRAKRLITMMETGKFLEDME